MHSRTSLVARKLSPTDSFSAYGTSNFKEKSLEMEVFCFFSNAVATRNGLLVKPAIELWPLPRRAHFRARREPDTIPLGGVDIPSYQRAGQENRHKEPVLGTR